MAEYDFSNIQTEETSSETNNTNPNYTMAFLAGFGTCVLVSIALAALGIWLEAEYAIILIIGAIIVSVVIHKFVPQSSVGGAFIGAILTPATYLFYQLIMAEFG